MKKLIFLIIFILSAVYSQNSETNYFSFGIQTEYVNQGGDLGKYWGNTFSAGGYLRYHLTETFQYEMGLTISKLSEGNFNGTELPEMIIINIPLGGVVNIYSSDNFSFTTFIGIENIMMIFEESDLLNSNLDESEFGLTVWAGLNYNPIDLEVFLKFKNMFSAPDNTPFFSIGIKKRLF